MESTALPKRASPAKLLIPLLIGAAVALGLGIYGKEHEPTGRSIFSLVFTKTINMKAWFATADGAVGAYSLGRLLEMPSAESVPLCRGPAFQRFRGRLVHGRVLVLQPVWLPVVLSQSAACTKRWPVAVAISKAARRSRGIAVAVCR